MHPLESTANSAFFVLFTLINEDHAVSSFFFIDERQLNPVYWRLKKPSPLGKVYGDYKSTYTYKITHKDVIM